MICTCGTKDRPALEHAVTCPCRLGFYGGDPEWGVGKQGEVRVRWLRDEGNVMFSWTGRSWERVRWFGHKEIR